MSEFTHEHFRVYRVFVGLQAVAGVLDDEPCGPVVGNGVEPSAQPADVRLQCILALVRGRIPPQLRY